MADHSKQISKLREAAFRGWIKELQDVEEDRFGNAVAPSQIVPPSREEAPTELPLREQFQNDTTEDFANAHRSEIEFQQQQTAAAIPPAQAEPNSPETRVALDDDVMQTDLSTAQQAAPAIGAMRSATHHHPPAPQERQPDAQSFPARTDQSVPDQSAPGPNDYATSPQQHSQSIDAATQKLIKDLRVMKRTRFNAQERFEAKHKASVAAFTLAAVFEIGLSLVGTNFLTTLPKDVSNFINFSSQITAVFILGFGLVATLSNYQTQALYLQRCAMDWGNLSRELQIAQPVSQRLLQDYRRRYHEIEGRCPPNHAAQDWRRAQLNDKSETRDWRAAKYDFFLDVHLIYALTGIGYVTFFALGLWQSLG